MVLRSLIVSGMLLAGALFLASATRSEEVPLRRSLAELPERIGTWRGEDLPEFDRDILEVLGVDDYINRAYFGPEGTAVGLYIGYYLSQRQGDTIHSPLNCLPGAGWNPVRKDVLGVPVRPVATSESGAGPDRGEFRINRIVIQKGADRQIVLYWYQSQGRVIASEYWGKIYTVVDAIRKNRTDAALVRVTAPVKDMKQAAEEAAEQEALAFVESLFPMLDRFLPN